MVQETAMPARHKRTFVFPGARRLKYLRQVSLSCSPKGPGWRRLPALHTRHKAEITIPFLCPKQIGFHPLCSLCSSLQPRTRSPLAICTPTLPASWLGPELLVHFLMPDREQGGKGAGKPGKGDKRKMMGEGCARGDRA